MKQAKNQLQASSEAAISELNTTELLRKSFNKLKITGEDITAIAVCFEQFLLVRHEDITDYPNIQDWFTYLEDHGYNAKQIIDIIDTGKELPKYRKGQLAIGDLITHWRKTREQTMGISWHEFSAALKKILESDKDLIDKFSLETTGLPFLKNQERADIKNYLLAIKERTEAELASCQLERKFKTADLIAAADAFNRIDQMISYEVILVMRAMLHELEHTTRQPLRVLKSKLDDLETNYRASYSRMQSSYSQEIGEASILALRILKGYDDNITTDINKIEEILIKYNLLHPEY